MNIFGLQTSRPTFVDRIFSAVAHPGTEQKERELALYADHLDRATSANLEAALLLPSPRQRAEAFAQVVENARGKSDARCLFAATVEGVRQMGEDTKSPLLELAGAAVESSASVVDGAVESHLSNVTNAACTALKQYGRNPNADLLGVAADMEEKADGILLDDLIPTLARHREDLANPLAVLNIADRETERHGSLYAAHSAAEWMRELQADPNPSVPRTFALILKDSYLDHQDVSSLFDETLRGFDPPAEEISSFVDSEYPKLRSQSKESLIQEWLVR